MWTLFYILISLLVGGTVGYLFGSNIVKHIATALGRPYHHTAITRGTERGTANVDAQFNSLFIYELERLYDSDPKTENIIDRMAPDNEKVAIYLYDMIANIAENYLPPEPVMGQDIGADVPPLAYRGGEEVRQVVDLGKQGSNSTVDFVE